MSFSSRRHGGKRRAVRNWVDQGAGGQHGASDRAEHASDDVGKTTMEKARGTTANREVAEFGEKVSFQPMMKYSKGKTLDVRWQHGLFLGVTTRTNEIMVSGPDVNETEHGHSGGCQKTSDGMQKQ